MSPSAGTGTLPHELPSLPASPSAILLVRLTARGDLVFSTPLIRAFRRTFPDTRLDWLAEPHTADIVAHHPELDDVLLFPRRRWQGLLRRGRWLQLWREVRALRAELRSRRYEVAVDLQGLARSGLATWLSGAPMRIGLGPREGSGVFMTDSLPRDLGDSRRISSEYLWLAEALGLDTDDFAMDVVISDQDEATARDFLSVQGAEADFAVAVPFTTRPQKHWVEERWPAVLRRVQGELGLRSVVLGGPADRESADRILAGAPDAIDLVGRTTLGEAAAVVRRASLLIGVDTALTHLGSAYRVPTIALFGSTTPYLLPPAPSTRILYHRLPCSPCVGNPTCDGAFTCMKLIGVDEILAAAGALLAAPAAEP
jgi:heptosyltransferase-1